VQPIMHMGIGHWTFVVVAATDGVSVVVVGVGSGVIADEGDAAVQLQSPQPLGCTKYMHPILHRGSGHWTLIVVAATDGVSDGVVDVKSGVVADEGDAVHACW
jgi:hypothetical protein